jgi:TldD protein
MRAELILAEIAFSRGPSLERTVRDRRAALEGSVCATLRLDGRAVTAETARWAPVLFSPPGPGALQGWGGGGRESVERALALHGAVPPPAMEAPALFSPSAAGVLLHEICGHLLEADLIVSGINPFLAAPGERIAAEALTIMDDPIRKDGRVWIEVDDEGEAARVNLLVDSGILAGYLCDTQTASANAGCSTGNGRRDSYRHPCLPRMTNLSVAPGTDDPADLLTGIGRGLYVERLGRGQVDPRRGEFRLEVEAGRLIESGSLGRPAAGAFIVGSCRDLLLGIDGVGGDVAVDPGAGVCIKEDQIVPVGQIAPSLRLSRVRILPGVAP